MTIREKEIQDKFLIKPNRRLTDEEQRYRDAFILEFSKRNYIFQDGERIIQWLDTDDNYRYYNPMWFSSNYGYTYSVSRNGFRIIKPNLHSGGKQRKEENRFRWTDYVKNTYKNWEKDMSKGYCPQHYYYVNAYPKSHGLSDVQYHPIVHVAMAYYFMPDEIRKKVLEREYIVHHIKTFNWNRAPQLSNRSSNYQILKEDTSKSVSESPEDREHVVAHEPSFENIASKIDKSRNTNIPVIAFDTDKGIEDFVLGGLWPIMRVTQKTNTGEIINVIYKPSDVTVSELED